MWFRFGSLMIVALLVSSCSSPDSQEPYPYHDAPLSLYRPLPQPSPDGPRPTGPAFPVQPPGPSEAWPPKGQRLSSKWQAIVIHHSATERGSAATFDQFHRGKGWDELGYHFVIGNGTETADGLIEIGPRWHKQKRGAHCKTPDQYFNERGIGICLVGDFTRTRPTVRQMNSLTRLVRYLCHACDIPSSRITTHGLVNPKTQCPGPHFSLGGLRGRLAGSVAVSSTR